MRRKKITPAEAEAYRKLALAAAELEEAQTAAEREREGDRQHDAHKNGRSSNRTGTQKMKLDASGHRRFATDHRRRPCDPRLTQSTPTLTSSTASGWATAKREAAELWALAGMFYAMHN